MASTDDDEEYTFDEVAHSDSRHRYPIHDCCEFEDAESLKRLIFVPQEEGDVREHGNADDESSSSEDSNDSTAAARAAAIGHSPLPIPAAVSATDDQPVGDEDANKATADNFDVTMMELKDPETECSREVAAVSNDDKTNDSIDVTSNADGEPSPAAAAASANVLETETSKNASKDEIDKSKNDPSDNAEAKVARHANGDPDVNGKHPSTKRKIKYHCPYNLNARDPDENTPLHVAILSRKLEHVQLLLEAGASVHKRCDGSLPVHTAISLGALQQHVEFSLQCVIALHKAGADLTSKDESMHTPLYLSCMYNVPAVAKYLLSSEEGKSTLNLRSDRSGGRPLHAAAKFDLLGGVCLAAGLNASHDVAGNARGQHHHPDGTVVNATRHIPRFPGKLERIRHISASVVGGKQPRAVSVSQGADEALMTQLLLTGAEIEIDAKNSVGQTPLHIACLRGNWPVVRCLLEAGASPEVADLRGYTPGQLAHRRGMPIPQDLLATLGDPPSSGTVAPPRDLIVDPNGTTMIICHELCTLHRTCAPIRRNSNDETPPENVRRLHVLVDEETGILRAGEFAHVAWENEGRRAALTDVLKVHEYNYIESISRVCSSIPDHPTTIAHLDADTTISRWSFEAALRAAGSVCDAVDKVISGEFRNAFCAIRPPGHHAGPRGIVRCANDPEGGSHGFCLLNNVAIGAAYARSMYRNDGIQKIAIIDFDVHHGNGTEEVIRQLVPGVDKSVVRTPFALGELVSTRYRPWLDETDIHNVFFASTHGYGPRGPDFGEAPQQPGWFYPASGKTHTADSIANPTMVEVPNLGDFLLSQTWTRMGEESRHNACKIINCGLSLPNRDDIPGMQRLELRDTYRKKILPYLREFDPDLIFISAGFDAHRKDSMNFGYVGMVEDDYEWVTEQLVKIANTCCNGRIVSVLEGGYRIHGGLVSPFARSVASHVRALVDGDMSRELYDEQDGDWESQFERHLVEDRESKRLRNRARLQDYQNRRQYLAGLSHRQQQAQQQLLEAAAGAAAAEDVPEDPDAPSRKRRRNHVDYRELHEQMKKEGFAD